MSDCPCMDLASKRTCDDTCNCGCHTLRARLSKAEAAVRERCAQIAESPIFILSKVAREKTQSGRSGGIERLRIHDLEQIAKAIRSSEDGNTATHTPKLLTMPCGCWASPNGIGGKHWRFCNLHGAAKELAGTLEGVIEWHDNAIGAPLDLFPARAAIAKAKGETK